MKNSILIVLIVTVSAISILAQADIHAVNFKNFTYSPHCADENTQRITVINGEYSKETQMDDYVDRLYFRVFEIAYGDLNGDGRDEAVILSSCNTGGTGNFSEGFVYTIKAGKPVLVTRIPGGDRAYGGLHSARVEKGRLVVESNDVGEMGGACCPEFRVTSRYKLVGTRIVPQGAAVRSELFAKERVSFPRGATGVTLKASIGGGDRKRYVVGARAGQNLSASVNSDQALISLLEDADITEGINNFLARLPKNADYTIEIQNQSDKMIDVTVNIRID